MPVTWTRGRIVFQTTLGVGIREVQAGYRRSYSCSKTRLLKNKLCVKLTEGRYFSGRNFAKSERNSPVKLKAAVRLMAMRREGSELADQPEGVHFSNANFNDSNEFEGGTAYNGPSLEFNAADDINYIDPITTSDNQPETENQLPRHLSTTGGTIVNRSRKLSVKPWSFMDEVVDPLASEALLGYLVKLNGKKHGIYAAPDEVMHFHIETWEKYIQLFKRMELGDARCLRTLCHGSGAAMSIIALGATLLILALVVLTAPRSTPAMFVPYKSNDASVSFHYAGSKSPVWIGFKIQGFYSAYRTYFASRPREIAPGFKCDHEHVTWWDFKASRPGDGFKPYESQTDRKDDDLIFPCGSSAFALFDDEAVIENESTNETIPLISEGFATRNTLYAYGTTRRPVPGQADWTDPKTERFRIWMAAPVGDARLIPLGIKPDGLERGRYVAKFKSSSWPAEEWAAVKNIAFIPLTKFGSDHKNLGITLIIVGGALGVIGILFLIFVHKLPLVRTTLSVSEIGRNSVEVELERLAKSNRRTKRIVCTTLREGLKNGVLLVED